MLVDFVFLQDLGLLVLYPVAAALAIAIRVTGPFFWLYSDWESEEVLGLPPFNFDVAWVARTVLLLMPLDVRLNCDSDADSGLVVFLQLVILEVLLHWDSDSDGFLGLPMFNFAVRLGTPAPFFLLPPEAGVPTFNFAVRLGTAALFFLLLLLDAHFWSYSDSDSDGVLGLPSFNFDPALPVAFFFEFSSEEPHDGFPSTARHGTSA